MKSLEIVNSVIRVCKAEDTAIGLLYIEGLEQIKADLEVLEIIKNKKVDISYLKQYFNDKRFTLEDIHYLTTLNNMYLTLDELKKIKQWLEVNE